MIRLTDLLNESWELLHYGTGGNGNKIKSMLEKALGGNWKWRKADVYTNNDKTSIHTKLSVVQQWTGRTSVKLDFEDVVNSMKKVSGFKLSVPTKSNEKIKDIILQNKNDMIDITYFESDFMISKGSIIVKFRD
jgi:hypothetical protein